MSVGIYTDAIGWKKRIIAENMDEIINATEWFSSYNEPIRYVDEWNDEDITEQVTNDINEYKELKDKLEKIDSKY